VIRLTILSIFACILSLPANGQSSNYKILDKAERLYAQSSYRNAIKLLVPLANEGEKKAIRRLADIYKKLEDPHNEAIYLAKMVEGANTPNIVYLQYGEALMKSGYYTEAKKWLLKFDELVPNDSRGRDLAAKCDNAINMVAAENDYAIYHLNINSEYADLCPAYYKDGIIYVAFDERVMTEKKYMARMTSYMDMFYAEMDKQPWKFKTPTKLPAPVNTPVHDGPGMFNHDGSAFYFTRNNEDEIGRNKAVGVISLGIYESKVTEGKFGTPRLLEFNGKSYSCAHPTVNKAGNVLVFTSDIGGGLGGKDLYYSQFIDSSGTWGKPVNLGPVINTSGGERYPFLHPDGSLYFSSDGHPGYGGADVFRAIPSGKGLMEFSHVENLGKPVNSQYEDFGFICDAKHNTGYFTSNRPGGKGSDDLYYFVKGTISAKISLLQYAGKSIRYELRNTDRNFVQKSGSPDHNGQIEFKLEPASSYSLSIWVDGRTQPVIQNFVTGQSANSIERTITIP
jgi:hypothetical protein